MAFTDANLHAMYLRFSKNIEVDMDPDLRWCPTPDCGKFVRLETGRKSVDCECGTRICLLCGYGYEYGNEQLKHHVCGLSEENTKFEVWKKEQGGKNCPRCDIVILKNWGCNHVMC